MTALIGSVCVAILWGAWATRSLIIKRREINRLVESKRIRNAKLEPILNQKIYHGKEQTKKGQAKETGKSSEERD